MEQVSFRILYELVMKNKRRKFVISFSRSLKLTSDKFKCCYTETERVDHDICLSRAYYTSTDPTSRELVPGAGIEPMISWPEVARSTDWATTPLQSLFLYTVFYSVKPEKPICLASEDVLPGTGKSVTVSCSTTKVNPKARCTFEWRKQVSISCIDLIPNL